MNSNAPLLVGINGFSKAARIFVRLVADRSDISIVALNETEVTDIHYIKYLLKFDSVYGRHTGRLSNHVSITRTGEATILEIGKQQIRLYAAKEASHIPWSSIGVDYVLDFSNMKNKAGLSQHIAAGARRVIVAGSGMSGEGIPSIVFGVNEDTLLPSRDPIVATGCPSANCASLLCSVLNDEFGIAEGAVTALQPANSQQPVVDAVTAGPQWRLGRSGHKNIVLVQGSRMAEVIGEACPTLKGLLVGLVFRVPAPSSVASVDVTVRLQRPASIPQITRAMQAAVLRSEGSRRRTFGVVTDEAVSSDFIGDERSCIFDAGCSVALQGGMVKVIGWVDADCALASRVLDVVHLVREKEQMSRL